MFLIAGARRRAGGASRVRRAAAATGRAAHFLRRLSVHGPPPHLGRHRGYSTESQGSASGGHENAGDAASTSAAGCPKAGAQSKESGRRGRRAQPTASG